MGPRVVVGRLSFAVVERSRVSELVAVTRLQSAAPTGHRFKSSSFGPGNDRWSTSTGPTVRSGVVKEAILSAGSGAVKKALQSVGRAVNMGIPSVRTRAVNMGIPSIGTRAVVNMGIPSVRSRGVNIGIGCFRSRPINMGIGPVGSRAVNIESSAVNTTLSVRPGATGALPWKLFQRSTQRQIQASHFWFLFCEYSSEGAAGYPWL
jgi:hypothetical protein